MRTFMLAVTGFVFAVAACSSYGTSVVEVEKTRAQVASVSLAVPLSLVAGQTARATATPKDANGTALTDRPVTWFTSSASIASVSDSGIISAVAPGTAVVSAVSEGIAGQASMAVMPPPPTPIATVLVAVNPSAVLVGQAALATATLEDSSGNPLSGRVVTWESSDISVATVEATGNVKAVGPGNAMIKASSEGKTNSSRLSVSAPAPIPVASVSVSPASASLQVGASVQLSAVTRDANNNVLTGRVISWSSGNTGIATVSGSGLVTAAAAGNVSITASSEGQTASAAFTVSAPAPVPVASVSVSPPTASLQVGGTLQLSAVTRDANNNVLTGRVISWSSSNTGISTVSASGLVTAIAAGSATITATSETKIGTAGITVTSAPPPPPPGTWRGNEPAGMTLISDQNFTTMPSDGWSYQAGATTIADATAPQSPSSVMNVTLPAGTPSGNGMGEAWRNISGNRTLYMSMWVKFSSNWQGHLTTTNKIGFVFTPTGAKLVPIANGVGTGPLRPEIYLQTIIAGGNADGGRTGVYISNLLTREFTRGSWDLVEMVSVANTTGTSDGSVDMYLNGEHVAQCTGIQFDTVGFTWGPEFHINPIWGGGGDVVTNTMSVRVDHIYLSGKR